MLLLIFLGNIYKNIYLKRGKGENETAGESPILRLNHLYFTVSNTRVILCFVISLYEYYTISSLPHILLTILPPPPSPPK